jgi:hypothetical protein
VFRAVGIARGRNHAAPDEFSLQAWPFRHAPQPQETSVMRTLLLWAVGVPLPIIALYWLFG